MRVTRAVTHIRLCDVNHAKLAVLDAVAAEYRGLCQQYTTYFCTDTEPDGYFAPCFESVLSQRWQQVAILQAAGIARSWRSNHAAAHQDYLDQLAEFQERHEEKVDAEVEPPTWHEWQTPVLKETAIQSNANVALLQPSEDSSFTYGLRRSTLEQGQLVWLPVRLAAYHQRTLAGKTINGSVTLTRKPDGWWLTLAYDETVPVVMPPEAVVVGIDVGIVHFLTSPTGKHYGTFHGKLAQRHQRDRGQRRRKAKLRACLKKKGVQKLPSTRNGTLARSVRQEINRAVNAFYADHPNAQIAFEHLHVAGMRFKARRMNGYLYASNLAHLPKQVARDAAKRGVRAQRVMSAYSSQEYLRCHFVSRENRPTQQTFCCAACGYTQQADLHAAGNLANRLHDRELAAYPSRQAITALLAQRHQAWRRQQEQEQAEQQAQSSSPATGWP